VQKHLLCIAPDSHTVFTKANHSDLDNLAKDSSLRKVKTADIPGMMGMKEKNIVYFFFGGHS
jgi:hypothetical protein